MFPNPQSFRPWPWTSHKCHLMALVCSWEKTEKGAALSLCKQSYGCFPHGITYLSSPPCSSLFLPLLGLLGMTTQTLQDSLVTSLCLLLSATISYAIKMTRNSLDSPWLPAFLKKLLARNIKESLWNPQQMPGTDSTACVCSATLEGTDCMCSATLEGSEGLWSRIPLWRSPMDSSLADSTYPWSLQLPSNIWGLCLPGTFHIATTAPLKAPHPLLVPGQDGEHSALMLCSSSLREQGRLGECRRNRQSQVLMRIPKGALKKKSHREQAGC